MQERPTGLVRGQRSLGNGMPRRVLLLLIAALPASVWANEPGEAPIVTIKAAEPVAERAPQPQANSHARTASASVDRAPKTRLDSQAGRRSVHIDDLRIVANRSRTAYDRRLSGPLSNG